MNDLQKKLLDLIQTDFPLMERPFALLANKLATSEAEIIAQIQQLKDQEIIRRIGPVFEAVRLGFRSTLIAAQVPPEQLDNFVREVNRLLGVSHNYGREHAFNVWFTLTQPSGAEIELTIEHLRRQFDLPAIHSLPVVKKFKIEVNFRLASGRVGQNSEPLPNFYRRAELEGNNPIFTLTPAQLRLIQLLQEDLPLAPEPFAARARQLGQSQEWVIAQIEEWLDAGVIRRFGAALRHHQAGFTANAMLVFDLPQEKVAAAGEFLASLPEVSHCYERRRAPAWPYNLYGMAHARTEEELARVVARAQNQLAPAPTLALRTLAEYKKESVRYF